ncbi:MAG: hypothetical protein Q4P28_06330 [Tissierellia bacterium]|nr:hypothetical protein [Tissierellia bacterium]
MKEMILEHNPIQYQDILGLDRFNEINELKVFKTDETLGILPHDIPNDSFIFVDRKAKYKKGDYILIKDSRITKSGMRITRALNNKEKDYQGKIIITIKTY